MSAGFLDTLWQALRYETCDPILAEETDAMHMPSWPDAAGKQAINWDTILEESGSSQFALHLFLMGAWEGETILQR